MYTDTELCWLEGHPTDITELPITPRVLLSPLLLLPPEERRWVVGGVELESAVQAELFPRSAASFCSESLRVTSLVATRGAAIATSELIV